MYAQVSTVSGRLQMARHKGTVSKPPLLYSFRPIGTDNRPYGCTADSTMAEARRSDGRTIVRPIPSVRGVKLVLTCGRAPGTGNRTDLRSGREVIGRTIPLTV